MGRVDTGTLPCDDRIAHGLRPGSEDRALCGDVGAPQARQLASFELRGQAFESRAGIGDHADRDGTGHADVARVHVDVDDAALRRIPPVLVERHVEIADTRAHDQHHVRVAAQLVCRRALGVEVQRVIVRHDGTSRHRRDYRAPEQFGKPDQRRVGLGAIDARAGEDHRRLCVREQLRGRRELRLGRLRQRGATTLARKDRRGRGITGRIKHGTRNLEVNRAGAARPHLAERHADEFGNPGPLEHRTIPLDHRLDQIELVLALERRGRRRIHHARTVLRGDREHGDAFVPRRQQAGHEVRGARPGVAEHHRDLAGRLVETFGHVHGGCLVPDRHEADAVGIERSEQRVDLRAGQPEDEFHAFVGECACKQFATSEFAHGLSPPEERSSMSGFGSFCAAGA